MLSTAYNNISPLVFIIGTFSFLCSFYVHIQIWRATRPTKQMALLAIIFVLCPLCIFLVLCIAGHVFHSPGSYFVRDPFNIFYVFVWHLALSAAYIMSYPAIQAESPSLVILLAIGKNMPGGMGAQQIKDIFPPDALIKDRFDDLLAERFMKRSEDRYVPTPKGQLLSAIFKNYRRLLALPRGDG